MTKDELKIEFDSNIKSTIQGMVTSLNNHDIPDNIREVWIKALWRLNEFGNQRLEYLLEQLQPNTENINYRKIEFNPWDTQ